MKVFLVIVFLSTSGALSDPIKIEQRTLTDCEMQKELVLKQKVRIPFVGQSAAPILYCVEGEGE